MTGAENPTKSSAGKTVALVGGIGALVLAAGAALFYADHSSTHTESSHQSYDPAATVQLVADGDVTVSAAEGDVEVEAIAHSGLLSPSYSSREESDRLVVTHECRWWPAFLSRCSGELDVTLPAETELVVRTSNGTVIAAGIAGTLDVGTSNGSIESAVNSGSQTLGTSNGAVIVSDAGGDVAVSTSNGRVEAERIGGSLSSGTSNGRIVVSDVAGHVTAETSNGQIDIDGFGGDVHAVTSNGDVSVTGDGEPVRLMVEVQNGAWTFEQPSDPDADRTVQITTNNGDAEYLTP